MITPSGTERNTRRGLQRGVYLLPNLCTMANLFFGFLAILKGFQHEFATAAWAILAAGLCDQLDGRMARLAHAESDFGVEFDALADLVSFGLAPGLLMYHWALSGFGRLGLITAFLFVACGALRLARFNVQKTSVEKRFFQGLPIPMAASTIVCGVIAFHVYIGKLPPAKDWRLLAGTLVLALLMISNVRYRSFKQINLRSRHSFFFLALLASAVALIAAEPELSPFILCVVYLISGLLETAGQWLQQVRAHWRQRRRKSPHRPGPSIANVRPLWPPRQESSRE